MVQAFLPFATPWLDKESLYQENAEKQNFRTRVAYYSEGSIFTTFCTTKPKDFLLWNQEMYHIRMISVVISYTFLEQGYTLRIY